MSINPHDPILVANLVQLANHAASVNNANREKAERAIKDYQSRVDHESGFVLLLLNMATTPGPAAPFCSIMFKNTVKLCWNEKTAEHCIMECDKTIVRDTLPELMLRASSNVRRNLAEAITLIAAIDFPKKWPSALDRIVYVLVNETDITVHSAALSTAHSILGQYRDQGEYSEDFVRDLRIIYTKLTSPLLLSMEKLLMEMDKGGASADSACKGLVSAVECLRDLTSLDLGDEFIWSMNRIVHVLLRCLQFSSVAINRGDLIELKSVVMSCVAHFLLYFDEDFEKHAGDFLKDVWHTIASPESQDSAMDDLVIQGMNLLSAACRGSTREILDNGEVLHNLVVQVILPNLALRQEDIELYESEPEIYIQRDIEGSDFHTRRREAGDLVRSMMLMFQDKCANLFLGQLQQLMTAAAGGDWKAKDLTIYLFSAVALDGQHASSQRGAMRNLSALVPFNTFLEHHIMPELSSGVSAQSPFIIKADCIRFVATFRSHIDLLLLPNIVEVLIAWIHCPDEVVYSYAAHAIERIFTIQQFGRHEFAITEANIGNKIPLLLQHLCMRLQESKRPNAYIMQCLLRVCQNCPNSVARYVGDIITCMVPVIGSNAKNPSNPLFSHCMFEVVSKCIKIRPEDGAAIEAALWEPMIYILQNDVVEFVPYTLQIMAQLLDTHGKGAMEPPAHYQPLLEPLLVPDTYQQRGSIPAVVRLLVAFIEHYPQYVHNKNMTEKALSVFRSLLAFKNYDHEGLNILTAIVIAYPKEIICPLMGTVYQLLFQRLQNSRTPKYVRIFVIFMSIVVVVHGPNTVVERVNQIQAGLFFMILQRVWLPNVQKVTGVLERKVCVVALANILGESTELQRNGDAWADCVLSCLKIIHGGVESDDITSFTPVAPKLGDLKQTVDDTGFTNAFCPLEAAVRSPIDVCQSVKEPDMYFRQHIQQVLRGPNGAHFASLLQAKLTPDLLALVQ